MEGVRFKKKALPNSGSAFLKPLDNYALDSADR